MEHPIAGTTLKAALILELTALSAGGSVAAMESALALIGRALPYLPPATARFVLQNGDTFKDGLDIAGGFMPGVPEGMGGIPAFIRKLIYLVQKELDDA